MEAKAKKLSDTPPIKRMVENIIRCKWSLSVIGLISSGVNRPGAMERSIDGLTTKVLNERLRKLVRFGIITKTVFPETPPRVEYEFTEFGRKFVRLLDAIEALEKEISER
jgi:DNA-binding HxlR family transcriptional regulator